MNTVKVNASKDYNIYIGNGLLDDVGERIKNELGVCSAAVITDDNVNTLYADRVITSLEKSGFRCVKFVFPHGEESKNISVYSEILSFLAENHITRSDMLISLGGGIPGDQPLIHPSEEKQQSTYLQVKILWGLSGNRIWSSVTTQPSTPFPPKYLPTAVQRSSNTVQLWTRNFLNFLKPKI